MFGKEHVQLTQELRDLADDQGDSTAESDRVRYEKLRGLVGDVCAKFLPGIGAPVLLLHGRKDVMCPLENVHYFGQAMGSVVRAEGDSEFGSTKLSFVEIESEGVAGGDVNAHSADTSDSNRNRGNIVVFEEGKHNLHLRFAAEFNDIITAFIRKVDAGQSDSGQIRSSPGTAPIVQSAL
jgi:pimeloyl-ACP methyl ester carboxylesterase